MNRRWFLLHTAAGLVLAGCKPEEEPDPPAVCLDEVLAGLPADLAVLGGVYLSESPFENDGEMLWRAVFGPTIDSGDVTAQLLGTIRDEHAAGDVVSVGGWRFSLTEARLAALVYLAEPC